LFKFQLRACATVIGMEKLYIRWAKDPALVY